MVTSAVELAGGWDHLHKSQHFVVRPADSLANGELEKITAHLERMRASALRALGLDGEPDEPVQVYLVDQAALAKVNNTSVSQASLPASIGSGGRGQIHALYQADVPGFGLDRPIVEHVLKTFVHQDAARAAMLVDGLVGCLAGDPAALNESLRQMSENNQSIRLAGMLEGPTAKTKTLYHQIATSFVDFLLTTYGKDPFKRFLRRFSESVDASAEAAYGKPLLLLEKEWLQGLHKPRAAVNLGSFFEFVLVRGKKHLGSMAILVVSVVMQIAFSLIIPFGYKMICDQCIETRDLDFLIRLMGLLGLGFVLSSGAGLLIDYSSARLGAGILRDVRHDMLQKLQSLSTSYFKATESGDIISRFSNDLAAIETGLIRGLPRGLFSIFVCVLSAILLFFVDWHLAILTLGLLPVAMVGSSKLFGPRATKAGYVRKETEGQLTTMVQENVNAHLIIRVFSLEKLRERLFVDRLADLRRDTVRDGYLSALVGRATNIFLNFVQLLIFGLGGYLAIEGEITIGALVGFVGLLLNVGGSADALAQVVPLLIQATSGLGRVNELLAQVPQMAAPASGHELSGLSTIEFNDVTFSYTGRANELDGISLDIRRGQYVAFVGSSGSGKSTILNLLLRLYAPRSGKVTADGHDISMVDPASLYRQIGVVFQEPFLFNTSIRENIRLGNLDAKEEDIIGAARAAEIDSVIKDLPEGYETKVGERGGGLSGGQRQRIALARAMVRKPSLLLLDEATSALDAETESAINATLERLARECTIVSVTHRLASVVHADKICVLDKGKLVESGTHDELVAKKGVYHRLWEKQSGFTISKDGHYAKVEPARIKSIPLLGGLDDSILQSLCSCFVSKRTEKGEVVIREGEVGENFFIIVRGDVEVLTTTPDGRRVQLHRMDDGDYFGEIALLEDIPRTATVRTLTQCLFLTLNRGQFNELLAKSPEIRGRLEDELKARREGLRKLRDTSGVFALPSGDRGSDEF